MRIKILLYPILERIFERIEDIASDAREYFAICTSCGENRYTGKPCVNGTSKICRHGYVETECSVCRLGDNQ